MPDEITNDVFRFVTVRAIQDNGGTMKSSPLIQLDDLTKNEGVGKGGLHFKIKKLRESLKSPDQAAKLLAECKQHAIHTIQTLQLSIEQLAIIDVVGKVQDAITMLLLDTKPTITNDSLKKTIQAQFNPQQTIAEFIGATKATSKSEYAPSRYKLWEQLYAHMIVNVDNGEQANRLTSIICVMNVIEQTKNKDFPKDLKELTATLEAIPVLPQDVFELMAMIRNPNDFRFIPVVNPSNDFTVAPDDNSGLSRTLMTLAAGSPGGIARFVPFLTTVTSNAVVPINHSTHQAVPAPTTSIRPLGIADLRVVRQTLTGYRMGEIAHIENILQSEERKRKHRHLSRTEQSFTQETETTKEEERDLQTTEKLELQRETNKTIQENMNLQAGVTVTSQGPVSVAANVGFSYSRAQNESVREASNYAKEVVDKSRKKIVERVLEKRTRTTTEEFEEINEHNFVNVPGTKDITGIYRWVDKIYSCQVVNYGKRLMFELVIPEPGAMYRNISNIIPKNSKPVAILMLLNLEPQEITWQSIQKYIKAYRVSGVLPMPETNIIITSTLTSLPTAATAKLETKIQIPQGYVAEKLWVRGAFISAHDQPIIEISTPGHRFVDDFNKDLAHPTGTSNQIRDPSDTLVYEDRSIAGYNGNIEVSLIRYGIPDSAYTVTVFAKVSPEAVKKWQLETYSKIAEKYNQLLEDQQAKEAEFEMRQETQRSFSGVTATNPAFNKQAIEEEIKKHSITMLTGWQWQGFDAMEYPDPNTGDPTQSFPHFNIDQALQEGPLIRFFENAFEWHHMTYNFYPYFWGRKDKWADALGQESSDPLFRGFLRAGAARVLLPVRPEFTAAMLWYSRTGELRMGSALPAAAGDRPYLDIIDELREKADDLDGGTPEGKPWTLTLPTTLVILNSNGAALESIKSS